MKVVIDGRMIGWTGIGLYSRKLLGELATLGDANDYQVLLLPDDARTWEPPADNFKPVVTDAVPFTLAEQTQLPKLLRELKPDLVHFLNFNVPLAYSGPYAVTVHDLTLVDYKNISRPGFVAAAKYEVRYWAMRLVLRHGIKAAREVITPSRFVKNEILQRYHVQPGRISVTHEAFDPPEGRTDTPPIKEPYLLYVGNPYPHKNLPRLVEAFAKLHHDFPTLKLVLACRAPVGNVQTFYEQVVAKVREQDLDKAVLFPEYIPSEELANWYAHAQAYVFPSLSEGFGLPALGAMSQGAPTAVAKASCLPEVCGDAAVYFDPQDTDDMSGVISRLLTDVELRKRLQQAGPKQAARYSWRHMAEQTLAVYRSALK